MGRGGGPHSCYGIEVFPLFYYREGITQSVSFCPKSISAAAAAASHLFVMPFHFHCHLSWSAPPPVEQAGLPWIFHDIYMALGSVMAIYFLVVDVRYDELKTSCAFSSENPCVFNSLASLCAVVFMTYMALLICWRWARNLSTTPTAVACILVNSPAAVTIIGAPTFLWGHLFGDAQFATCLSWVLAAALIVFLRRCISIDRTLSKNSPLPHLQEETCKNGGVLEIFTCDY